MKAIDLFNIANQYVLIADIDIPINVDDELQAKHGRWKVIGLGRKDMNTPKNRVGLTLLPLTNNTTIEKGEVLKIHASRPKIFHIFKSTTSR